MYCLKDLRAVVIVVMIFKRSTIFSCCSSPNEPHLGPSAAGHRESGSVLERKSNRAGVHGLVLPSSMWAESRRRATVHGASCCSGEQRTGGSPGRLCPIPCDLGTPNNLHIDRWVGLGLT